MWVLWGGGSDLRYGDGFVHGWLVGCSLVRCVGVVWGFASWWFCGLI